MSCLNDGATPFCGTKINCENNSENCVKLLLSVVLYVYRINKARINRKVNNDNNEHGTDNLRGRYVAREKAAAAQRTAEEQRIANGTKRIGDTAVATPTASKPTFGGFTDGMSPMQAKRATDALEKSVTAEGMLFRRHALVEKDVAIGAKIVLAKDGKRRLQRPNGVFRDESQISKTGMDYAAHLIAMQEHPTATRTVENNS